MKRNYLRFLMVFFCFTASHVVAEEKPDNRRAGGVAAPAIAGEIANSSSSDLTLNKNNANRFKKGAVEFGAQLGWGAAVDIPPRWPRTNWEFVYFHPNFKYNLTGLLGKSFYRGTLSWMTEAGIAASYHPSSGYVLGFSPLMVEYKFVQPKARIIPYVMTGAGFSYTDWSDKPFQREIATNFEFLLHAGAGAEFYKFKNGAFSVNYRFYHISNAGIAFPNIGINANLFTIGYSFF